MNPIGLTVIVVTTLFPAYLLATIPDVADKGALFSQYLGIAALLLMAWGQILSTRFRGVERVFGGLDRVYVLHKWTGILAMTALLLHDTIDADMRGLGRETALNEVAETLGEFSLYGLLILVVISVATFIPYHLWKWTHKAMGALFAAGSFHFFFIMKPFSMGDPAGLYAGAFCVAGLLAYGWTLLPERMRPSRSYRISAIERSGDALAITMRPEGRAMRPLPGQFGVFRFTGSGLDEAHPFSFSKIGTDGSLRISIKALGDFSAKLPRMVQQEQEVRVQGPFGRFRRSGNKREVWIAGGIGITPFLTWAAALDGEAAEVDLFYCVKSREDAAHLAEVEELARSKPNLTLHVFASSEGQRLSPDVITQAAPDLAAAKVCFCGPASLRDAMRKGLRQHGLSPRNFHYEEFEFRTGIGLRALAAWVLTRNGPSARIARSRT